MKEGRSSGLGDIKQAQKLVFIGCDGRLPAVA